MTDIAITPEMGKIAPRETRPVTQENTPADLLAAVKQRASQFSDLMSRTLQRLSQSAPPTVDLKKEEATMQNLSTQLNQLDNTTQQVIPVEPTKPVTDEPIPFSADGIEYRFDHPTKSGSVFIRFESENHLGDELEPGKRIVYIIPDAYRNRTIRDVVLIHRKDPSRWDGTGRDQQGAYDRVEVVTPSGKIVHWIDPAGYSPDKFAESRSAYDPEVEILHDWVARAGEVSPRLISVLNIGHGELAIANVHGLEVVFFPDETGLSYEETIYSPGTRFIDLKKHRKEPDYGIDRATGTYPGAIELGGYHSHDSSISNDASKPVYSDQHGRLHIKLKPGRKFVGLELAAGDTHPDGTMTKEGMGTRGWAKIYAGISRQNNQGSQTQHVDYFMSNVNVPPAGVLFGGPNEMEHVVQEGDELVIESRADITYLMGFRVSYRD